ncbi:MAG: trans-sulfuration enzyme family protein [Pyrinomonadaceae bacterium]
MKDESFFTLAVHAGEARSENHGAVSVPIYNSTVFAFTDADDGAAIHNELKHGYYYGRNGNPTAEALERTIAQLENGEAGLSFTSGMAAVSASVLANVKSGDHIVAPESMYSTTTNFLKHLAANFDVETTFVDAGHAESYGEAVRPNTKVFWIETPSNPLVKVTDIRSVVGIAKENGIVTIADNTFATPFNQRPIDLGVDIVIHSATKYLGGHSDVTAGLLVGRSEVLNNIRKVASKLYGGTIAPQAAWLVARGIKTLALRMQRHNENAYAMANMLSTHPKVAGVYYPGLVSHSNHNIAREQMTGGFGGMIGVDLETLKAGKTFVNGVEVCTLGTSLGGVESIVQHSATMTHSAIPADERIRAGISDGLVRFSVGIEDIQDLKADVLQALEKV